MKRFGLAPILFVLACGAQNPDVAAVDADSEDVVVDDFGLSTLSDTYVIVRRDYRKCVAPLCGGFYVRDVNRNTAERYVNSLDFSSSDLDEYDAGAITGAPDDAVVLYGRLGKREKTYKTRPFLVTEAYRGLPGVSFGDDDQFYSVGLTKIACITTPCHNIQASRLNRTTGNKMVSDVVLTRAQKPLVDTAWLSNRILSGRALVAGTVLKADKVRWLDVGQVFLRLPDRVQGCAKIGEPSCSGDLAPGWSRDANRCLVSEGCVQPMYCAAYVPGCDEGYTSVSWQNGCTRYACEPDFL